MTYVNQLFNESFENTENEIPILIVENIEEYRKILLDILIQIEGYEGENSFYIEEKEVKIKAEVELITDIFNIDVNKTKNLTKLYSYLNEEYVNEKLFIETREIYSKISNYLNGILIDVDYELEFNNNIDMQSIFKSLELKFKNDNETILEKLIDYIKIQKDFMKKKLFILTNFKTMFTTIEQENFYKFIQYEKVNILIIETFESKEKIDNEKYRIIDKNLCVIY